MTITFDGASDDLIHASGHANYPECDEIDNAGSGIYKGCFILKAGEHGGKMRVHAIYDGCWSFAPGLYDEDTPYPGWPLRCFQGDGEVADHEFRPYSMILEIDAPKDTTVKYSRHGYGDGDEDEE